VIINVKEHSSSSYPPIFSLSTQELAKQLIAQLNQKYIKLIGTSQEGHSTGEEIPLLPSPPGKGTQWYKNSWFIGGIGILAGLAASGLILLAYDGNSGPSVSLPEQEDDPAYGEVEVIWIK